MSTSAPFAVCVAGLVLSIAACGPSAAELEKRARDHEAAEQQRAQAATALRKSRESDNARALASLEADRERAAAVTRGFDDRSAAATRPQASAQKFPSSSACPITAARAIARLRSCGLNVEGFTPEEMCSRMGQPKLNFVASRGCEELGTMLFGDD